METIIMIPFNYVGGIYLSLGYCMLGMGLYYLAKAAWLTLRRSR